MRGATSNPELPKLRFLIRAVAIPNLAECPDQNAGESMFGCILLNDHQAKPELLNQFYPERGTRHYLVRAILRSIDICYLER